MSNETNHPHLLGASPATGDFRLFLQKELVRRCQANSRYSLRAYAKFLGIESSRLSKILRGERPARGKLLTELGQKLGLSPTQISAFDSESYRRKQGVRSEFESRNHYLQLSQDAFESIEDWRHYAILEMMKLPGFQPDSRWISQTLGVSLPEAHAYVERLQRVGLLKICADGRWFDHSEGFSTHILSETETTYAHRRSQKKILELAMAALETTPMDRRDQSSMMMATHSSKIGEAKKMIKKFRKELCDFLEDVVEKDAVYQLSTSLFPIVETKLTEKSDKSERIKNGK